VQDSFATVVSVDGLLFALYYALTGIATAVYYRKLAVRSPWSLVQLAVCPLAAGGLAYIVARSVEGLGRTASACRGRRTSPTPDSIPQTLGRDMVPRPPGAHIVYRRLRAARLPSSASPVQRTRPASICSCGSMRPQASWTNVTESVLSSTSGWSM